MNILKLSLRLKLTDFIETDVENIIINKIINISNEINNQILVYLWYNKSELKISKLNSFIKRWNNAMRYKTIIRPSGKIYPNEFIWFDIIPAAEINIANRRYKYIYDDNINIIDGIVNFCDIAKFCLAPKPPKKQKRND